MARERAAETPETDSDAQIHSLNRRRFLRTSTVAVGGLALLGGQVSASSTEDESVRITLDYDDYDDPSELYNIFDVRTNQEPRFSSSRTYTGNSALETTFDGNQKTANIAYEFGEHGYETYQDEVYSRFQFHPDNVTIEESGTLRFYWAGVRQGPQNSGVNGAPSGDDGWTIALSLAHRGAHEHPDGYTLSVYTYHMDQPGSAGESFRTEGVVDVDRWNEIECYQRINTYQNGTANADGIFRLWLDGELVFEKEDFRWVTADDQGVQYVGPLGYWYLSDQQGQSLYYDDHEIHLNGAREPEPYPLEEYEDRLTYRDPGEETSYRFYVDGEIIQHDWSQATENETVEIDSDGDYQVVTATSPAENVDGYVFTGDLVAIDTDGDPRIWISGERVDLEEYPSTPPSADEEDDVVDAYRNADGDVDNMGLLEALEDYRNDDLSATEFLDVRDEWRSN